MKTKNSILIIFIVLVMSVFNINAQETELTQDQQLQFNNQLEVYGEKLNLSEKQKPKFRTITKKYLRQLIKLKDEDRSKISKFKEFKTIIRGRNDEMKLVLDKEQYERYEKLVKQEIQKKIRSKRDN